jgi:hypothetical protein
MAGWKGKWIKSFQRVSVLMQMTPLLPSSIYLGLFVYLEEIVSTE